MAKERHKEVPAAYVMLIKDNKILMARRFNTGYMDGFYSLPAGHVDEGESFTQCAVREAKEEVGVELKVEDLKFACTIHRLSDPEWKDLRYRIDMFFIAEKWKGEPKIMEPDKSDELNWFDLDALPENTIPYVKQAIKNAQGKIFYSELGWYN